MKVFGRRIAVLFQKPGFKDVSIDAKNLNIGFTVERNLDIEPSTLLMTIYNLSPETREKLKDLSGWTVSLSVGYGPGDDNFHSIFKGDVRFARNRREPPDLMTEIEADDGGAASRRLVSRHFGKNVSIGTVLKWLQEQSGLGAGNVERISQIQVDGQDGLPNTLKSGITIRGYVLEEMHDLAKSRGAILSSQNNEVVVLRQGEPLAGLPVTHISPRTGLIGYPSVDNEGILTLVHRMLPFVQPGSPIQVDSEFVKGPFVVERAVYSGSLWGDDFNTEIEGRAIPQ